MVLVLVLSFVLVLPLVCLGLVLSHVFLRCLVLSYLVFLRFGFGLGFGSGLGLGLVFALGLGLGLWLVLGLRLCYLFFGPLSYVLPCSLSLTVSCLLSCFVSFVSSFVSFVSSFVSFFSHLLSCFLTFVSSLLSRLVLSCLA